MGQAVLSSSSRALNKFTPKGKHTNRTYMRISEYVLVAFIGFGGVVVGALINALTMCIAVHLKRKQQAKLDRKRKELLKTMLDDPKFPWRELETLKRVVGADEATTICLLLDLGARGSEDRQALWGLISRNPFPDRQ